MNIYLVRVGKNEENGTLFIERKPSATTDDSYVAISHVWGDPATIQSTRIKGVEWNVSLSPGKNDVLNLLRREDVCGDGWFWMDLFCIDQRPDATISISEQLASIPSIYKSSRCVKVLIELPLCEEWHATATRLLANFSRPNDAAAVDAFGLEELQHAIKCPHMVVYDPWFERLWTRQEGLYGLQLQLVALNRVPCAHTNSQSPPQNPSAVDKFNSLKIAMAKRSSTEVFLQDKSSYHGVVSNQAGFGMFGTKNQLSQWYLDLIYRHNLVVADYGGKAGPSPGYSPVGDAWRSARITTKARDYVLAIFPDIPGYHVPANARRMTFDALLDNALRQLQEHMSSIVTFPKGMLDSTVSPSDSLYPWIPRGPSNCMEAFDGIFGLATRQPVDKLAVVAPNVILEQLEWTKEIVPELLQSFKTTTNVSDQYGVIYFYHPWFGAHSNQMLTSEEEMLKLYLTEHFFSDVADVKILTPEQFSQMDLKDITDLRGLHLRDANTLDQSNAAFIKQLRRFLASLVCGTALGTADVILESAEFVFVHTPLGKLLALVNAEVAKSTKRIVSLLTNNTEPDWELQGLLLGVTEGGHSGPSRLVGRTVIPKEKFWSTSDHTTAIEIGGEGGGGDSDPLIPAQGNFGGKVQDDDAAQGGKDGEEIREERDDGIISALGKALKSVLDACRCCGTTVNVLE